jgi:plastocyanin domain-containing protein
VVVNEQGYEPPRLTLRAGAPSADHVCTYNDTTCGTEVVFLSLNIKRALPLNVPVVIEFTPQKSGDIAFACGTNMLHGTVVVQ